MTRLRIAGLGGVGIAGGPILLVSIAVMTAAFPKTAGAQSAPEGSTAPLTDRERSLLERIQNLESEVAALHDVQERLAAIEARLGEVPASSTGPDALASDPTNRPAAVGSDPTDRLSAVPLSCDFRKPFSLDLGANSVPVNWWLQGNNPSGTCNNLGSTAGLFRHSLTSGLFGGGLLRTSITGSNLSDSPREEASGQNTSGAPAASPPPQQAPLGSTSGQATTSQTADSATTPANADDKTFLPQASDGNPTVFGEFNPGRGFVVGKGPYGELDLSGYMAVRYLNQLPPNQSALDHLGRPIPIEPRNDFQFHRIMLFAQGWLFDPRFQYATFVWTVQDTNQVAVGGSLSYGFSKYFNLGAGWNAYPGTQSLQGSHPYWESFDRVMADEFFRPYFSQGVFAQGNLLRTLQYRWMVGNNNSNLDVPATKLDRDLSAGFAITWLPTTGEFGPRGAFGDYEDHEKVATRFNLAYTYSPEDRQSPIGTPASNTTLRLADSLNLFDTGALANGVTVESATYQLVSAAAGMKYRGFWLQGEGYARLLDHFVADGPLPVSAVRNTGFYVQAAKMIVPNRIELYASTSYVFGEFGRHPHEFIVGGNYYPWNTRNLRLNLQVINVSHSPVSSTFGFYIGQITGQVVSIGFTAFY